MADFFLSDLKPTEYVRYRVVSANTTALNLDYIVATGNIAITLPASPAIGSKVLVKAEIINTLDYVRNKINVVVNTANTFASPVGGTSFVIDVNNTTTIFVYTTNGWRIS